MHWLIHEKETIVKSRIWSTFSSRQNLPILRRTVRRAQINFLIEKRQANNLGGMLNKHQINQTVRRDGRVF